MAEVSGVEEKIERARFRLALRQPFFAYLLSKCRLQPTERVRTAGINLSGTLYYSPSWLSRLPDEEVEGVLAHEVLHLASKHIQRRGERKRVKWNVACDYATNLMLHRLNFSLPAGVLLDKSFKGMAAEQIYDRIGDDWPEYICDLLYEGEGDFDVDAAVEEAARLAKAIGRLPGELEEFLGGPFSPRMAWRELLWRYVARYLPSDYSWRRPSKRLRAQGIYLPRVVRDEELRLCVAVDVSGSVSEGELRDFLSEVAGICGSFQQVRGKLITCDCSVQDVFELDENFRPDRIRIRGRGGTSTVPVFEYIRQNVPDCRLLVYLTDGETGEEGMPREPPPYPVIWVIPSDGTDRYIRFGEVLRMG